MGYQIKYQYAKDESNRLVNVLDLKNTSEIRGKKFICLSCDQVVVPVLGEIRQKHFRHLTNFDCNSETYLHNLSKRFFFETYNQCLESKTSFDIELFQKVTCKSCEKEFGISCELDPSLKSFSLTSYFPKIFLETQSNGFIPDVLLTSETGEKVFVEFAVSHFSSDEKVLSGEKIIEVSVIDEASLQPIHEKVFSQANNQIHFFNFIAPKKCIDSNLNCDKIFFFFILKKDGSAHILSDTPIKYQYRLSKGDVAFSKRISLKNFGINIAYLREVISAYKAKLNIKNCFLCRYHAKNESWYSDEGPIFCKFLRKRYKSTKAVSCEYYRPDQKAFNPYETLLRPGWNLDESET